MQDLSAKLRKIKKDIERLEGDDRLLRGYVNEILTSVFGPVHLVKEILFTKQSVILVANNKACAQEIFLRQGQISQGLKGYPSCADYAIVVR